MPGSEPIAEAGFVQRIPNVMFMYSDANMEFTIQEPPALTAEMAGDGPYYSAGVVVGQHSSPVALTLTYVRSEADLSATAQVITLGPGTGTGEAEGEELSGRLVFYASRRTAFGLEYGQAENTTDLALTFPGPPLTVVSLKEEGEAAEYSVLFKHLAPAGSGRWIDVFGSATFVDSETRDDDPATTDEEFENWEFALTTTFYPNRRLGIVLGFDLNSGDDESDEGVSASAGLTYNFGTRFGFTLNAAQFWANDEDEAEDELTAQASLVLRF